MQGIPDWKDIFPAFGLIFFFLAYFFRVE